MNKYLLLLLLGLSCPSFADYNAGIDLFNRQQYAQAFAELKPIADKNSERAQYYVAYMYLNGYGVGMDTDLGIKYLTQSADQGYEKAQALLGYLYAEGKYVKADKKKAIDLYTAAAKKKDDDALLNLGIAYYIGDGVDQDQEKAIELLSQVNPANNPSVGRHLADIYLQSNDENLKARASDLYLLSASQGDIPAFYSLARLEQNKPEGTRDFDKMLQYYTYAASQGYAPAQYALGIIYANGEFVDKDLITGYAWIALAANQMYEPAQTTQRKLEENMPPSKLDKTRSKIVEIQQTIFGKVQPPVAKASTRSLSNLTGMQQDTQQTVIKKKRPRSRARGGRRK